MHLFRARVLRDIQNKWAQIEMQRIACDFCLNHMWFPHSISVNLGLKGTAEVRSYTCNGLKRIINADAALFSVLSST